LLRVQLLLLPGVAAAGIKLLTLQQVVVLEAAAAVVVELMREQQEPLGKVTPEERQLLRLRMVQVVAAVLVLLAVRLRQEARLALVGRGLYLR
jgi:hypothetical protein